jgi:hypothetical protein
MSDPGQDPAEGSRDTIEHELKRSPDKSSDHPENRKGAAKATKDNDLTTGHTQEGDGGDANSK